MVLVSEFISIIRHHKGARKHIALTECHLTHNHLA